MSRKDKCKLVPLPLIVFEKVSKKNMVFLDWPIDMRKSNDGKTRGRWRLRHKL